MDDFYVHSLVIIFRDYSIIADILKTFLYSNLILKRTWQLLTAAQDEI